MNMPTTGRVLNVTNGNEGGYTRPALQGPVRQVPPPKSEEKREYIPIDIESFPDDRKEAYTLYREYIKAASDARKAFEALMLPDLQSIVASDPELAEKAKDKELTFWYYYGQLNISFEVPNNKKSKKDKRAISFNK